MWAWKSNIRKSPSLQHVALYFEQEQVSLLAGIKHENKIAVNLIETFSYQPDTLYTNLLAIVEKHQLRNSPAQLIISDALYELFSLEPLLVNEDEIHDALRWKLKDLITYPIDDCCWDYFQMPSPEFQKQLLYVITTARPWLKTITEKTLATGLKIENTSIPALVMKRFIMYPCPEQATTLPHECQESHSLLYEENDKLKLLILYQNQVYIIRQFDHPVSSFLFNTQMDASLTEPKFEELALFLQRSFDYYQSQLHQMPVSKLFLTVSSPFLLAYLQKNLTCHIETLSVTPWLDEHSPLTSFQKENFILLAALLDEEE
ncbi:MAG: hypothetical protein HY939_04045 [Gammaproteobacteria bacterium]|nr:hypothetical protein [Gammaproteobacteria bacterium]